MRWNCPHCLTMVSVGDDKIGSGWLFSKCYKCSGFSLVRRTEVEVVKVEGSPFDGKVSVSSNATGVQAKVQEIIGQKKVHESALAIAASDKNAPNKSKPEARPVSPIPRIPADGLFNQLKEIEARNKKKSPIQILIGIVVVSTLGSGLYLYFESQSQLQKKYRPTAAARQITAPTSATHDPIVDRVSSQAMAPARDDKKK